MNESDEEEKDSGVPLNEEGKPDFSATIRMPELKIPKSMINVDPDNASSSLIFRILPEFLEALMKLQHL